MMDKAQLFDRLSATLRETFEIEPSRITPEARLREDLDLDSLDAVDLLVQLRPVTANRLTPEVFKAVRTLQDVVDALHGALDESGAA